MSSIDPRFDYSDGDPHWDGDPYEVAAEMQSLWEDWLGEAIRVGAASAFTNQELYQMFLDGELSGEPGPACDEVCPF